MTEPKSARGGTREGAGRPKVLTDDTMHVGLQLRKKTNARLGKAAKKQKKTKSELAEEILSAALQT